MYDNLLATSAVFKLRKINIKLYQNTLYLYQNTAIILCYQNKSFRLENKYVLVLLNVAIIFILNAIYGMILHITSCLCYSSSFILVIAINICFLLLFKTSVKSRIFFLFFFFFLYKMKYSLT